MWHFKTASPDRYELLKTFSTENRKHPTEAEAALWNMLRASQLGVKFLRQHIIGDYIVDFVCRDNGLIIEVDGAYHAERQQQEDDALRTTILENLGFRVIRFSNEEVLFGVDNVIEEIENYINN